MTSSSGSSGRTVSQSLEVPSAPSTSGMEKPSLEGSSIWNYVPLESPLGLSPLTPGVWTQPTRTNVCFWDDSLLEIAIDSPGVAPIEPAVFGLRTKGKGKEGFPTLGLDGTTIRIDKKRTALVIIDMQNFFLDSRLRARPLGLECVAPIQKILPACRSSGITIIWLNWGLLKNELPLLPPSHTRVFQDDGLEGIGTKISKRWGRLLMRGSRNAALYPPLQEEFEKGFGMGSDYWVNKNRMSGLWGRSTELAQFLERREICTLMFAGLDADQSVPGTFVDAYSRGYDCVMLKDAVATNTGGPNTQPVNYNAGTSYGFATDTSRLLDTLHRS